MSREEVLRRFPELAGIETELGIYDSLLQRWSKSHNLVAASTLSDIWMRHFADSIQLLPFAEGRARWADIGSGAGFPGIVLALALKSRSGAQVHLVEADQRKVAFLREVSRETKAPTTVHSVRADAIIPDLASEIDVLCSRAVAPLFTLVEIATPVLQRGGICIFPKGRTAAAEIAFAQQQSSAKFRTAPSKTANDASIVIVEPRFPAANPS